MNALVVYDSAYGNTEQIARSIGSAIGGDVKVLSVGEVDPAKLEQVVLLIVGSPTQAGRPTKAIQAFLKGMPASALQKARGAAFDTRLSGRWVAIFGYAAGKIADSLKAKGTALASPAEGFFVAGKEGPLKEGEMERAAAWAKEIVSSLGPAKP